MNRTHISDFVVNYNTMEVSVVRQTKLFGFFHDPRIYHPTEASKKRLQYIMDTFDYRFKRYQHAEHPHIWRFQVTS